MNVRRMKINVDKYKTTYIGKKNPNFTYIVIDSLVFRTETLGIIIDYSMKTSIQCSAVFKKAENPAIPNETVLDVFKKHLNYQERKSQKRPHS